MNRFIMLFKISTLNFNSWPEATQIEFSNPHSFRFHRCPTIGTNRHQFRLLDLVANKEVDIYHH